MFSSVCTDFTKPADDCTYRNVEEYIIVVNEDGGNHVMEWDTNNGSNIYITPCNNNNNNNNNNSNNI